MVGLSESEKNQLTYQRLKDTINRTHPKGCFVAIADDRVVATASSFRELERSLLALGKDPRAVLVVEAGVDVPEYVTIFA
jgi:hypothetical protein